MPKPQKGALQQAAPFSRGSGSQSTVRPSGPLSAHDEWKIKNAKAKELIMSTLAPGSEPWNIAEPLESAADIWKAIEAKYAPKQGGEGYDDFQSIMKGDPDTKKPLPAKSDKLANRDVQDYSQHLEEFYTSVPNPNQRLLWAILHGGTPETDPWFTER